MIFPRHAQYSGWDGTQEPLPLDAEHVMDRVSEDVFAGSDFEFALRRILSSGWRGRQGERLQGIEELVEMVRRRRLEQLNRYNLESVFDDIRERLDHVIATERRGIRERLDEAEEGSGKRVLELVAKQHLEQLEDLPPSPAPPSRSCRTTSGWTPGRSSSTAS